MSRGSLWRKWDLHVHTPNDRSWMRKPDLSSDENLEKYAELFIQKARKENLSVLAITDHNICNGKFINLLKEKGDDITILPGTEICVPDCGGIHILIIFPEDTDPDEIEEILDHFFPPNSERFHSDGSPKQTEYNIDGVKERIDKAGKDALFIFAHADGDKGVLNAPRGESRINLWKKEYIRICQLSKPPGEYDRDTFVGSILWGESEHYNKEMAYINASDCRGLSEEDTGGEGRRYLGEVFTWIKADPCFEGLKQIVYEPEERVGIQPETPEPRKSIYTLSSIKIQNSQINDELSIEEQEIPLNRNLIAVTGGKGSGKTALLDLIANCFEDRCKRSGEDKNSFVQRIEDQKPDLK